MVPYIQIYFVTLATFAGFLLLDNNHLLGDLSLTCANEGLGVVYVDCGEIECPEECCNCCVDGKLCHDYDA